jgi:hypothetical protein
MRTFLDNRHPDYLRLSDSWQFWAEAYEGGNAWIRGGHLFRFARESETGYQQRLKRASRTNYTRQIVDLLVQYVGKESPVRNTEQASEALQRFWKSTDRAGQGINGLMRNVATAIALYGTAFVVVDKPVDVVESVLEENQRNLLPYAYCLSPLDVLDWTADLSSPGALSQVLVRERIRGNVDLALPRESDTYCEQFRLWQKTTEGVSWKLFDRDEHGDPQLLDSGDLSLSQIPIIQINRSGGSCIEDTATLDRKLFNYESLLDQILYEQTFSTLLLPWTGQMSDFYEQWELTLGTKAILPYEASAASSPRFIAPDAGQGDLILRAIEQGVAQIYRAKNLFDTVGDSSLTATTAASGVARAYDFEKMNAVLSLFADDLEKAELGILNLVSLWHGETLSQGTTLVDYPDHFDVKTLAQELQDARALSEIAPSASFRRYLQGNLINKAAPKLSAGEVERILSELDMQNNPDSSD